MRMGAVDYIAKPFDHDEMVNAVKRYGRVFQTGSQQRSSAVGILGGWVVGVLLIGVDPGSFWSQMQGGVDVWKDVGNGAIKSLVFGIAVTATVKERQAREARVLAELGAEGA